MAPHGEATCSRRGCRHPWFKHVGPGDACRVIGCSCAHALPEVCALVFGQPAPEFDSIHEIDAWYAAKRAAHV
jgi:hypothetical protein